VPLVSDPETTRLRISRLSDYMIEHVLGPDGFRCRSAASCTRSALVNQNTGLPGPDRSGETLSFANEAEPVHVMDVYALANVRLCSAVVTGTTSSKGTRQMAANCLTHLKATIRILEPTLCILQSGPARDQIAPALRDVRRVADHLERVDIAGVRLLLASFVHPHQEGAQSIKNWGRDFSTPYLDTVVGPTIRAAGEAGGLRGSRV